MLVSVALIAIATLTSGQAADLQTVGWHDNLEAAGSFSDGGLTLDLRIEEGMWHPNGVDRAGTKVLAFAERGGVATTPGPLLRVRLGTRVSASVENTTGMTLVVHGLGSRRGLAAFDSLLIPAGETVRTSFVADAEGTFYYWGAPPGVALGRRQWVGAMLTGAFVVDPATGPIADDRILLIAVKRDIIDRGETADTAGAILSINGRPWPHTERMEATVGDSVRWRVINSSERGHPMHLHGFYFRVDAAGDFAQDTIFDPRQQRMAVTEHMGTGGTLNIVWSPNRPGGWLFHCHLSYHVMMNVPLGEEWQGNGAYFFPTVFGSPNADADNHVERHMGGLMMVTNVVPKGEYPIRRPVERSLRLLVTATSDTNVLSRQYGYRLDDGTPHDPGVEALQPSPTLVLQKNQPTDIVVVNTTDEATSVHWHGIEIESYSDGVVGVGGYAHMPTPAIMPGDSFVARVTVPRSGSFMYHTHVADINQQGKGLAGSIVVVDDLQAYDPSRERVYLAQTMLNPLSETNAGFQSHLINRQGVDLPADTVQAGGPYRLRFMNMTLAGSGLSYRFVSDGGPVDWTTVAKDGFDLPAWQQKRSFASRAVSIGETVDVLWRPRPGGSGWLELRGGNGNLRVRQRIEVVTPDPPEGAVVN